MRRRSLDFSSTQLCLHWSHGKAHLPCDLKKRGRIPGKQQVTAAATSSSILPSHLGPRLQRWLWLGICISFCLGQKVQTMVLLPPGPDTHQRHSPVQRTSPTSSDPLSPCITSKLLNPFKPKRFWKDVMVYAIKLSNKTPGKRKVRRKKLCLVSHSTPQCITIFH